MVIITIDKVLAEKNITRYNLAQGIKCNYQNLCRLCNNKTTSISLDMIYKICVFLNCSPNDILQVKIEE